VRGLLETDVARVQRWCRDRVPERVRDEVHIEVDVGERHVTIVECRAPWRSDMGSEWTRFPIARLRYTKTTRGCGRCLAGPQPAVPRLRLSVSHGQYRGVAR